MKINHILYSLTIFFLLNLTVSAQTVSSGEAKWVRLKDDKIDFSILFPPNYLVDNEIEKSFIIAPVLASMPEGINLFEKPRITGYQKSVRMSLSVYQLRQVSNAKKYLWYFLGPETAQKNYQDFQVGDFVGRKTDFDTEESLAMQIAIAVKSRVFMVTISADREDKEIYEKFLKSLELDGKSLFGGKSASPAEASQSALLSTLQTSPEIFSAINQKTEKFDGKNTDAIKDSTVIQYENKIEKSFSRPLIIIRQPPIFFGRFGDKTVSGKVKLKITFLATGEIGEITANSELPDDQTKTVITTAQKIKFLPAEIGGRKVSLVKTLEYNFDVK